MSYNDINIKCMRLITVVNNMLECFIINIDLEIFFVQSNFVKRITN